MDHMKEQVRRGVTKTVSPTTSVFVSESYPTALPSKCPPSRTTVNVGSGVGGASPGPGKL